MKTHNFHVLILPVHRCILKTKYILKSHSWDMLKNNLKMIGKGKCILKEQPFVYVLKSKYRKEMCDFCLKTGISWVFCFIFLRKFSRNYDFCVFFLFSGKVLKCSGCQYVYYCNRECQTNAWKFHKAECVCLKRANGRIVPDAARVMARIILKLNDGGDTEKGYYTEKFYRKFKDLMSRKTYLLITIIFLNTFFTKF